METEFASPHELEANLLFGLEFNPEGEQCDKDKANSHDRIHSARDRGDGLGAV